MGYNRINLYFYRSVHYKKKGLVVAIVLLEPGLWSLSVISHRKGKYLKDVYDS